MIFNYIFPIFAFGIVITGIVFLGLQQASDLAKTLAAERAAADDKFKNPDAAPAGRNSAPVPVPTGPSRP